MLTSGVLDRAMPGVENAKDWLTLKIVECRSEPMDFRTAEHLGVYNAAYNALCQWEEEEKKPQEPEQEKAKDAGKVFTMEKARVWTKAMKNADGSQGPHWDMNQAKQIMTQRGIECDPTQFWAAINMIYSDYCGVAKKYNLGDKIDFYAELARAFLDDPDAQEDKLAKYYQFVVKH